MQKNYLCGQLNFIVFDHLLNKVNITTMLNFFSTLKVKIVPYILIALVAFCFMDCKSEVSMEKQQKAFHVDAEGNLLNKKGNLVKKGVEFRLKGG